MHPRLNVRMSSAFKHKRNLAISNVHSPNSPEDKICHVENVDLYTNTLPWYGIHTNSAILTVLRPYTRMTSDLTV